ncbi:MAG TPA: hypothetical protein VE133_08930 [Candidatus Sulfotelmatobacter sp.]|nr:hypothetical protein [Candidatus Sulfotelmatobacter sp.]
MRHEVRAAGVLCAAIILLGCAASAQSAPVQANENTAFTDRAASVLLLQLSEALESHSQKKLLALFDLSQMKDGPIFKQQINSFLSHTELIRVHLNLVETSTDAQGPSMSVDAEMEIEPRNGGPVVRRNERLVFKVARSGKDWKFINVQPRSFFSLP